MNHLRRIRNVFEAVRDRPRFVKRWPAFADYEALTRDVRAALRDDFEDYATRVSAKVHAVSLEAACFLWAFCDQTKAKSVIDLGSGFSSAVTRRWAKGSGATTCSVDDNPEWLEKTRAYLGQQGLDAERLFVWDEFRKTNEERFDVVFYDMGMMSTRSQCVGEALDLATPHGFVILDDMHKRVFERDARAELRRRGWSWLSLRPYTLDPIYRFSVLALPG